MSSNAVKIAKRQSLYQKYDNTGTSIQSDDVQGAITEVAGSLFPYQPVGSIGVAGTAGFGIGVAPSNVDIASKGLSPVFGHDDPRSDSFGNYIHTNGSIMCFIPKFYYRVGSVSSPNYDRYGLNTLDIVGSETFQDESEANANGYILHRAFIDGGLAQEGFFIDKYIASKSPTNANVAVSVKNGVPISLTATASGLTTSAGMTGCTGILADSVVLSKARGGSYQCSTVFMYSALSMISLCHGQYATNNVDCAWFDPTGINNFPKGCNDDNLRDANDPSVVFVSAGDSLYPSKNRTGSGEPFAKTTHNGQNCGVVDLNGTMWETAIGLTRTGASSTASANLSNDVQYVLKESVVISSLTAGWNGITDIWGNATGLANNYDSYTSNLTYAPLQTWIYWGNGAVGVFPNDQSGLNRALCGVVPPSDGEASAVGLNVFGQDGIYRDRRENLFVQSGGLWSTGSSAGVFARSFGYWRSSAYGSRSFRAATF